MELEDVGNVFSATDLWRPSMFSDNASDQTTLFAKIQLDASSSVLDNPYISKSCIEGDLKLPELDAFDYGPLLYIPDPAESVVSLDSELRPVQDGNEEDVWKLAGNLGPVDKDVQWYSWESFKDPDYKEGRSAYVSEAGPAAFDAVVKTQAGHRDVPQRVIQSDIFIKSLFALGLGRSSLLFSYDTKKRDFIQLVDRGNTTGYSTEASQSLISSILACGRIVRRLRDYVEKIYTSGSAFPAKVALANVISSILSALEHHLTESALGIQSLLQLQNAFDRPARILFEVYDIVKSMKNARSNEELASLLFTRCQQSEQEPDWLRSILLKILARVSSPWLEIAEEWIGIRQDNGFTFGKEGQPPTFVNSEYLGIDQSHVISDLQYTYRPEYMPAFIALEDGERLFGIGQSLRIIRSHHPDHPLSQPRANSTSNLSLEWSFEWLDMEKLVQKAKAYEQSLASAVRHYGSISSEVHEGKRLILPNSGETEAEDMSASAFTFDAGHRFDVIPSTTTLPDELHALVLESIANHSLSSPSKDIDFSPPIALTPVLSFNPTLAAQSRLVNAASIRLFFRSHDLRTHLDLQRAFHLLGDGVFVSRLTASLFDPNLSTTERQRGVMRSGTSMGLKLGSRINWPPASSELRLALMGILSECYQSSSRKNHRVRDNKTSEIPGSLSFAIRQLSDEEAEKIMEPESLHALDFLRLQYAAPSPLGAILTPVSLDKYDSIFKFLLRLARLLFIVSHLPRTLTSPTSCLFRLQAYHFVSTISAYFFDTGIRETWDVFTAYLDSIEQRLKEEDEAGESGTRVHEGIDDLRKQHELCLDRITFALLLRNRQVKVMALLDEIFGYVLDFAKICNHAPNNASETEALFETFRTRVSLFLDVCKGLVGKKGYGRSGGEQRGKFGKGATGEENMIQRLVVALDYNGFFSSGHGSSVR